LDCAKRYARTIAAAGRRVGLIAVDVAEFRLITFQLADGAAEKHQSPETPCFDLRAMRDAINELNCDLDCWLLAVANPRIPEARSLLRGVGHWVALCPGDHDGIVACYRLLKGLSDPPRPRLSLAAIDATEPADAERLFAKLSNVCRQFLAWPMDAEPSVGEAPLVAECQVMACRTAHDKAQLAAAPHWQVVAELLAQAKHTAAEAALEETPQEHAALEAESAPPAASLPPATAAPPRPTEPPVSGADPPHPAAVVPSPPTRLSPFLEVIDLADQSGDSSILSAVMRHSMSEVVECPLRPPMCPQARLAITRDRRIILIATAGHGLAELKSVALAFRWLVENRSLLAMALPQFALDTHQLPHLRLLVEQADLDAEALQPILQVDTVTIHTYRRVRWGQRTGLLLDAA
jgi:hypothetical protein